MELPSLMKGIAIEEIPIEDAKGLLAKAPFVSLPSKIFEIFSSNFKYHVIAAAGRLSENDLDIFESGFEEF